MKDKINPRRMVLVSVILVVFLTGLFFLITNTITKYTGYSISDYSDNDFKECLKEKDITLFVNSEVPAENLRENSLYEYLDSIDIVNCNGDNTICVKEGVNGPFPSWIINNKLIERDISIAELSENSGCSIVI